jgi:mannitol/fructose-specific phosphotransferase system IIA component (Ntr-type)
MQVLARLARKLMNDDFRERLAHLADPGDLSTFLSGQLDIPEQSKSISSSTQ